MLAGCGEEQLTGQGNQDPHPVSANDDAGTRTGHPRTHAILGVGGVGGLIGACLAHAGNSVTLVVRPEVVNGYPEKIRLESPFGNFTVDVAVAAEVPPVDVVWLAVKATQLDGALASVKDEANFRAIVPLLNGIDHIALLRSKYDTQRVVPAAISVESERVAPGHIVHRSPFARLNVLAAGRSLIGSSVNELQTMGFVCQFIDDEPTLMWGKLVFIAPFALATTAADKPLGEILGDPDLRDEAMACVREACAVGVAEGANVGAERVLAGVSAMPAGMRSSMQKDVEQGKAPELDAIAGPILRGGRKHGIEVPVTRKLVAAVEARAGLPVHRPREI